MRNMEAASPRPANDDRPAVRLVPLIGAIYDDGRFERFDVVELIRVPEEALRRGRPAR
jgi:hypothetical protein